MAPQETPFPTSSSVDEGSSNRPPSTTSATGSGPAAGTDAGADVMTRVVQGAHQAIDRMADTAAPAVQRLQEGVNAASDALSERAEEARALGNEWCDSLRGTVRENPLTAIAAAMALGLLVARLTR